MILYRFASWIVRNRKQRVSLASYLRVLHRYERLWSWGEKSRVVLAIEIFSHLLGPLGPIFLVLLRWEESLVLLEDFISLEDYRLPETKDGGSPPLYDGQQAAHILYLVYSSGGDPNKLSIREGLMLATEAWLDRLSLYMLLWNLSDRTVRYNKDGSGQPIEFPIQVMGRARRYLDEIRSITDREESFEDVLKRIATSDPILSKKDKST